MKKTDTFTNIIIGVLFVAAALYLFGWLWRSTHSNIVTAPVDAVSITDSAQAEGIAVREETLLTSDRQYVSVQAEDGQSAAKGEVLAISMDSEDGLSRMNHITELKIEIQSLQTLLSGASAAKSDVSARDANIRAAVLSLSGAVARDDLTAASSASMDLTSLVFEQDSSTANQSQLDALNEELSGLEGTSYTDATSIGAPSAGIFSRGVDGYESLNEDSVQNLTVARLEALFSSKQDVASTVFGKLVTSDKWYFAAKVDAAHAALLTAGKTTYLQFPRYYNGNIPAKVESISAAENGQCVIVFSSERALADTLSMRKATAQIVFSETDGLQVPLKAMHVDGDGTFVYCLTAQRVEKKYVDIISTEDDCYIVSVGTDSDSLREGNTLIVSGKDIYKGKVIES
jgi:hypothetical protein